MKPLFVISCPIDTYSGYGARSRDVVKALIELDKFDLKILPQRWGNCPWGFIENHEEEWGFLTPYILENPQLPTKPQVWAQISVPNEFQALGEFNIGFTAGIETTVCHHSWIQGLNRMDLNIVSSEHAKKVFETIKFDQKNKNEVVGVLELNKPVEVLFEGADITKYFPSKESKFAELDSIKEKFAFLFIGHWMNGDLGEDRKNVGLLIKLFYETFKNKKDSPALILKTSGAGASYLDRDKILSKIEQIKSSVEYDSLPNIYILHGELTDQEINNLYNHKKVKAMISLTKGEGFGRPLLEFSLINKPLLTTNWSGHTDFLDPKFTTLISGQLKSIHQTAVVPNILIPESQWFSPHVMETQQHLNNMFYNYKAYLKGSKLQYHKSKNNFSFDKMVLLLDNYLIKYLPTFVKNVIFKTPSLDKTKLKLPTHVTNR